MSTFVHSLPLLPALGQRWSPAINPGLGSAVSSPPWDLLNWALQTHFTFPKRPLCPSTVCSLKEAHPSKADANEEHTAISNPPADSSGAPASCMCCRVFTYSDYTESLLKSSSEVIQAIHILGYF